MTRKRWFYPAVLKGNKTKEKVVKKQKRKEPRTEKTGHLSTYETENMLEEEGEIRYKLHRIIMNNKKFNLHNTKGNNLDQGESLN